MRIGMALRTVDKLLFLRRRSTTRVAFRLSFPLFLSFAFAICVERGVITYEPHILSVA